LSQRRDPLSEARLAFRQGEALQFLDRPSESLASLDHALKLWTSYGSKPYRSRALIALARSKRALGDSKAARNHLEKALEIIEGVRAGIENPDLRAVFQSSRLSAYTDLIDLLMDLHEQSPATGHHREALELAERSRARRLRDLLFEARIDATKVVAPELASEQTSLTRRLSLLVNKKQSLATGADAQETTERRNFLAAEIAEVRAALDVLESTIHRQTLGAAELGTEPTPTAESIQRALDPGVLLLYYALGDRRSFLWAITDSTLHSFILPDRLEIEAAARQFHNSLSTLAPSAPKNRVSPLNELSQMLLEPAANLLLEPRSPIDPRLLVVADGALHYIPFAALPLPNPADEIRKTRKRAI